GTLAEDAEGMVEIVVEVFQPRHGTSVAGLGGVEGEAGIVVGFPCAPTKFAVLRAVGRLTPAPSSLQLHPLQFR
ncbi:MAG TPA: hypothetical protein VH640_28390, partial [Bryobacteraceae bacterium]